MSRTTTREIVQVCTELAKLDRRGKEEIMHYLEDELRRDLPIKRKQVLEPKPEQPVTYKEGEE